VIPYNPDEALEEHDGLKSFAVWLRRLSLRDKNPHPLDSLALPCSLSLYRSFLALRSAGSSTARYAHRWGEGKCEQGRGIESAQAVQRQPTDFALFAAGISIPGLSRSAGERGMW